MKNIFFTFRELGQGTTNRLYPWVPFGHEIFGYPFYSAASARLPLHLESACAGFGKISKPWGDYTYGCFADDLNLFFILWI